ncbi:MAG TPA: toll/interleukin-1 receptor domain-containing protein, partial [Planctomycetaceae bacterium]|nr:toll/interleukin-1 receptor domain-containing protein [Planctomycetaceae bacterium]HRA86792.1 toll/interleukin-1 receptor domain-containing protein [Planctomycetaceae bacterium]
TIPHRIVIPLYLCSGAYINSQLEKLAFGGSVERERIYHCGDCNLTIDSRAVEVATERGKDFVTCSACGSRFPLDDLVEQSKKPDDRIKEIDREAEIGQRLAGLATTTKQRRRDGAFDLFLCHNSQDKPAVRELAEELDNMGLLGWIDEEQLLPGDIIQEKLERAIHQAGAVAVCIGPHGIGRWQTVEYHAVYERLISESEPDERVHGFRGGDRGLRVISVLLPGATVKQIPTFLRRHMHVDLRKSSGIQRREAMHQLAAAVLERR